MMDRINWKSVAWLVGIPILGIIARLIFKKPDLYQPWYAWAIGALFLESVILAACILISSLLTSLIVKDYDDIFKMWANSYGDFEDYNDSFGKTFALILCVILFICFNIFLLTGMWNS